MLSSCQSSALTRQAPMLRAQVAHTTSSSCSLSHSRLQARNLRAPKRIGLYTQRRTVELRAEPDVAEQAAPLSDEEELESEAELKKKAADRLRDAEKFLVVGTGEAVCQSCGYTYTPSKGDPEYPISPGTQFESLPADWLCPVCSADKVNFKSKNKVIAGFAENQGYGFGTNSMTEGQKGALIWGSLAFFFALFLAGYFIQ